MTLAPRRGEFFTPPEVVDILVRILEQRPGDTVYDPTSGSGGMLVHTAEYLSEHGHHTSEACSRCTRPVSVPSAALPKRVSATAIQGAEHHSAKPIVMVRSAPWDFRMPFTLNHAEL